MLLDNIKDVHVGLRVCSLFDEFPGRNFFDTVTDHFAAENLWHVIYEDGDEEDMDDQEVLYAVNLARTLYLEDKDKDSHDTPTRTTPVVTDTSPPTSENSTSDGDRERALQE